MTENDNVGLAFALVIGAGLATALGASVVFVPSLIHLASRRTLAGALGLSAGVMTYVSFVEIMVKSQKAFLDSGLDKDTAYAYSTLCFFGGVVLMVVSARCYELRRMTYRSVYIDECVHLSLFFDSRHFSLSFLPHRHHHHHRRH